MTIVATLQVEELNIDMEPGDIVDDILGRPLLPLMHFLPCLGPKVLGYISLGGGIPAWGMRQCQALGCLMLGWQTLLLRKSTSQHVTDPMAAPARAL